MVMKKKNRPSFFAVLVQDYINKLLRTSCGEIWDVKIEEFNEYKYFTVGWRKFVIDAELRRDKFLVFWFNINSSIFDVSIFGIGGLERGISVQNNISITEDELDDDDDDDALAPATSKRFCCGSWLTGEKRRDSGISSGQASLDGYTAPLHEC
ncbi:PREDICTED: putative B3 domain-containing protein At5g66980 [Erythranthe guttata]|uniref:putative B3 domain-containing protein At5g66980 n=1 Tax=Erythranthe guttata TaxID=4155 RepID=UPI00064DFF8B|nr:PREDICTED: putative B3 domain-containing protein At5g66980 [Erythranthe guttata]|eukprot:XP_012857706.1 PREDICTED: putative B3 domain-containing protein At5g66980 [Erythranthe guttata]